MLVLSRKPSQKIQIGNEITITVVKVRGNVIRLGIDAPRDVRVIRAELDLTVDETMTAGIATGIATGLAAAGDEATSELLEDAGDEPGPRQSHITVARYTQPQAARTRGLASVMKKKALAS